MTTTAGATEMTHVRREDWIELEARYPEAAGFIRARSLRNEAEDLIAEKARLQAAVDAGRCLCLAESQRLAWIKLRLRELRACRIGV